MISFPNQECHFSLMLSWLVRELCRATQFSLPVENNENKTLFSKFHVFSQLLFAATNEPFQKSFFKWSLSFKDKKKIRRYYMDMQFFVNAYSTKIFKNHMNIMCNLFIELKCWDQQLILEFPICFKLVLKSVSYKRTLFPNIFSNKKSNHLASNIIFKCLVGKMLLQFSNDSLCFRQPNCLELLA